MIGPWPCGKSSQVAWLSWLMACLSASELAACLKILRTVLHGFSESCNPTAGSTEHIFAACATQIEQGILHPQVSLRLQIEGTFIASCPAGLATLGIESI